MGSCQSQDEVDAKKRNDQIQNQILKDKNKAAEIKLLLLGNNTVNALNKCTSTDTAGARGKVCIK